VSKFADKFNKETYNEDYAFKTNTYERKKRDKKLEERKSSRFSYSDDYSDDNHRYSRKNHK